MTNILVTGATGGYGSRALGYLGQFAPNANLYGLARSKQKAESIIARGFEARVADYADPASMAKALAGIDRVLFVSIPTFEVQKNVVEAAKASGVGYIAYTSLFGLQHERFELEVNHRATEKLIRESGIPNAALRDNWYLDMMADYVSAAARTGIFPCFSGEGKIGWALKREYAEAGARIVAAGNEGTFDLAGRPVTYGQLGEAVAAATGKPIEVRATDQAGFQELMAASGISSMGLMLAKLYQDYALAGNNGEEDADPDAFEKALGHPLAPLTEAVAELIEG